jgi:hypothetical protein
VSIKSGFYVEVVLLGNREVWTWLHESSGFGEAFLALFLCAAFALGIPFLLIGMGMKISSM